MGLLILLSFRLSLLLVAPLGEFLDVHLHQPTQAVFLNHEVKESIGFIPVG
jgi:hypothetical protein